MTTTLIFLTSGGCVATWHLYRPESLGDAYCICSLQLPGYLHDQTDRKFHLPAIDGASTVSTVRNSSAHENKSDSSQNDWKVQFDCPRLHILARFSVYFTAKRKIDVYCPNFRPIILVMDKCSSLKYFMEIASIFAGFMINSLSINSLDTILLEENFNFVNFYVISCCLMD